MSLCSIYTNKDKVQKYYKEINDKFNSNNKDDLVFLLDYVIKNCMIAQYDMKRNYLNINTINKLNLKDDLTGTNLLDSVYQHMYSHNHIAMEDEIWEVRDANEKYKTKLVTNTDTTMTELLILEELIDSYHFITELTSTLEEHYIINLYSEKDSITSKDLKFLYTGEGQIYNNTKELLELDATHISSYIIDNIDVYTDILDNEISLHKMNNNIAFELLKTNRQFIRKCNFKDWKQYPSDYFNPQKFAELIDLNRYMYLNIIIGIILNIDAIKTEIGGPIRAIDSDNIDEDRIMYNYFNIAEGLKILYATYMTKREENIRRQKEDKRYKISNKGESVGVEVK